MSFRARRGVAAGMALGDRGRALRRLPRRAAVHPQDVRSGRGRHSTRIAEAAAGRVRPHGVVAVDPGVGHGGARAPWPPWRGRARRAGAARCGCGESSASPASHWGRWNGPAGVATFAAHRLRSPFTPSRIDVRLVDATCRACPTVAATGSHRPAVGRCVRRSGRGRDVVMSSVVPRRADDLEDGTEEGERDRRVSAAPRVRPHRSHQAPTAVPGCHVSCETRALAAERWRACVPRETWRASRLMPQRRSGAEESADRPREHPDGPIVGIGAARGERLARRLQVGGRSPAP